MKISEMMDVKGLDEKCLMKLDSMGYNIEWYHAHDMNALGRELYCELSGFISCLNSLGLVSNVERRNINHYISQFVIWD